MNYNMFHFKVLIEKNEQSLVQQSTVPCSHISNTYVHICLKEQNNKNVHTRSAQAQCVIRFTNSAGTFAVLLMEDLGNKKKKQRLFKK